MFSLGRKDSFTLIELLVVLAIVAILSTVVVMALNPAELLKQARDSNRLSDLSTLNTALAAYSADVTGGFMGTSSVVYVSIPDTTSTCANLGLPTLPTGWSYNCVTSTSTKLSNGKGWIPVNFSQTSFGTPVSSLPVDPANTTSSGNYYTYVTGGSWQLSSRFESQKYLPEEAKTNSYDPGLYVIGDNTNLAPFVGGLVGWWKFDEGSGTSAVDSSGYGSNAQLFNSPTWAAGKAGFALQFTTSTYATSSKNLSAGMNFTVSSWFLATGASGYQYILGRGNFNLSIRSGQVAQYGCSPNGYPTAGGDVRDGKWHHYVFAVNSTGNTEYFYQDGVLIYSIAGTCSNFNTAVNIAIDQGTPGGQGITIDDLRIYNRVLSAAEILGLYNSTK